MRAAFDGRTHLIFFTLSLLIILSSPYLLYRCNVFNLQNKYSSGSAKSVETGFIYKEITEAKEDVDMLILGPSTLWVGLNASLVQKALSQRLGRPAVVFTLGHNWRGDDLDYIFLRDISSQRKIKSLILQMPTEDQTMLYPHAHAYKYFSFFDDYGDVSELPFYHKFQLYAGTILNTPRQALNVLRPNKIEKSSVEIFFGTKRKIEETVKNVPSSIESLIRNQFSAADSVYDPSKQNQYRFTHTPMTEYQTFFLKKLTAMAKDKNISLIVLNIPMLHEAEENQISEREDWSRYFGITLSMVGMSPAKLFGGLKIDQIKIFYSDDHHLNPNGTDYFTQAVIPGILKSYGSNL